MDLQTPIQDVNRTYKMYAKRLEKLGIKRIEDFLYHIPFRYDDFSLISKISEIQAGEIVTIQGKVIGINNDYTRRFKNLQKAQVKDESAIIEIIWFNQPYLAKSIKAGDSISLSGKVTISDNKLQLISPDFEILINSAEPIHTGRLVPIYPETKGISSKWIRRQIYKILQYHKQNILEYIPDPIFKEIDLIDLNSAIEQIHFPKNTENAYKAKQRLSFDELFMLQLYSLHKKKQWQSQEKTVSLEIKKHKENIDKLFKTLPFELTNAQKKATDEIFSDISSSKPMNRLLEGDVGSGKTVVSAITMYVAFLNRYQSTLLAPTEILAQQHFKTIHNLLSPLGVKITLITGNAKLKSDKEEFDVLIGTHAILSQNLQFKNLAFVVIDEQQRFGVEQRTTIRKKGKNPHLLSMTATPIPRTVALTVFGDLDLSYLDEMPKGRKRVKTWLVPAEKRENAYKWIEKQIQETKGQVFIVCPFIEESESMQTVKAATKEFERLQKEIFPHLKLGLLHGKQKGNAKEEILQNFKDKKLDILVATPVVEVGIDIINATIMVIETAERFGLSQLHQLRGRVGRGDKQSYCLLFTESKSDTALERLKAMESIYIGSELAELDLKLRGAGDIYGTTQHGIPKLKIASFSDFTLIEIAKKQAEKIFPKVQDYPKLLEKLEGLTQKQTSPD